MAGRPRKPTKLKVLSGTNRKHRTLENELTPDTEMPEKPGWLSESGGEVWDDLSKRFYSMGVLTAIDGPALAIMCQNLGRYIEAEKLLVEKGIGATLYTQKSGNITTSPMLWVSNGAMKQAYQLMTAFGMTPAARTKVATELKQKDSKKLSVWEKAQKLKNGK